MAAIFAPETDSDHAVGRKRLRQRQFRDSRPATCTGRLPEQFPFDGARDAFAATFPFHPSVLSVFERKWQAMPRFQQTRGILRLLALWVSRVFQEGFKSGQKDPLIGLDTAPLDDPQFRAAMFEQLGEHRLEAAVTTDICGKPDSHAVRLDKEAVETLQKARLHRKVATAIFFESNGGKARAEATIPDSRLPWIAFRNRVTMSSS